MSENLNTGATETNARPTFLSVLCILTFIGSGLGVIGGLLAIVGSSALAMFAPAGGTVIWSIFALISSVLCLFGAIQMWGLKKSGFMIYVAGAVVSIIVSIMNGMNLSSAVSTTTNIPATGEYGAEMNAATNALAGAANTAVWGSIAFGIVITLVFVLMYNANKKHLTK